jgi:regulator of extracellular matrix RemA (YlzA/DUF370 family)
MQILNIGYSAVVALAQVVSVLPYGSSGAKRVRDVSQKWGRLIDATQGHKARSVVITVSDHVFLSALQAETISQRMKQDKS